jgi:hypothetical protein
MWLSRVTVHSFLKWMNTKTNVKEHIWKNILTLNLSTYFQFPLLHSEIWSTANRIRYQLIFDARSSAIQRDESFELERLMFWNILCMRLVSIVTITIKYQPRSKCFEKMKTVDIQDSLLSRYGYCLPPSWAVWRSTSLAPAYKHLETHSATGDSFSRIPVTANALCVEFCRVLSELETVRYKNIN